MKMPVKHSSEDTACAVCWEHVESIVNAATRTPIDGNVANQRDDESNKNALTNGDIACRRCDSHQTYHTSDSGSHG